ncbi:MAG TPA: ABC transporter substrate-binding protein [Candidatus Limnocylindrales bacterium]|nr:ABC transporter substrate-binding protein [Candidatus Limnocylindrales bacterium]
MIRRILASLAIAAVLAACGNGATPPPTLNPDATTSVAPAATGTPAASVATYPMTVTDDEGTEVEIAKQPEKVVSLMPAITETLFALGVGDTVVGKGSDFFLYPPEASAVPDVQAYDGVEVKVDDEKIVGLQPDVVFAGGDFGTPPADIERLRSLGLPVVVLYAPTIDDVLKDISVIGQVVGKDAEAAAIVERMQAGFDAVSDAVGSEPRKRVFYELDATGAYYGPADDSFLAEMIDMAGAEPITTGSKDKFDIPVERLIDEDPEVILLSDAAFGVSAEQVAARPGWDVMTAVRNNDIRPIDDATVSRPGPRLMLGLALLARTIHPDADVPDLTPIPPNG